MKSKEEMIKIMARAINDSHPGCAAKWDEMVKISQREGYIVAKGVVRDTRKQAEAALEALCGALPDMPEGKTPWGSIEPDLVATKELYSQLKQWGEE